MHTSQRLASDPVFPLPTAPFPRSLDDRDRRSLRSSIACWTQLDGWHRVVLDQSRAIVACDPDFVSFVMRHREFRISDGRFGPADPQLAAALTSVPRGATEPRTVLVPNATGGHWICCAARLTEYGACELVAVTIRDGGNQERAATWPDFRLAFGLTATENEVLCNILAGHSPQQIADVHSLSVNTVRTHVRHLYDKLEVRSQHELWRKLCGYRLR